MFDYTKFIIKIKKRNKKIPFLKKKLPEKTTPQVGLSFFINSRD